jgi:hypothetical protein
LSKGKSKRKEVKKMTREEVEKRMKEVETMMFYLAMKDYWTTKDFERNDKLKEELSNLEKQLENF